MVEFLGIDQEAFILVANFTQNVGRPLMLIDNHGQFKLAEARSDHSDITIAVVRSETDALA